MTEANKNTLKQVGILASIFLTIVGISLLFQNYVLNMAWFFGCIMFSIFAMVEGYNEALSDHFKQLANQDHNGHVMFRVNTAVVFILLHQFVDFKSLLCYAGMYMFLHDGMYYATRHNFNPAVYVKGWFDFTDTPVAFTDKLKLATPIMRTVLYVASVVAMIIINYVNR